MVDVFISYSRTDLAKVTQLALAVEAEGYDVWWDADLPPHLSYGDVITAKIGMAKAAIVVWSKDSATSQWVRAEADMARNQQKLVQTALDNVMPPLPFNQIQYAEIGDWRGEPDHPGWRKIKVSLAELCGREPGPAVSPEPKAPAWSPPAPAPASRWPLFAGIAIGAIALALAGWIALRDKPEPSVQEAAEPPAALAQAASPAEPAPPPALEASPELAPEPPAVDPAPAVPEPAVASTEGMVFPDSNQRRLRPSEVANLGPATLAIARNEIFARKGMRFRRAEARDYFLQFDWYRPVANQVRLTAVEQQNVALLEAAQRRYGQVP